jgi:hypothetical protein
MPRKAKDKSLLLLPLVPMDSFRLGRARLIRRLRIKRTLTLWIKLLKE